MIIQHGMCYADNRAPVLKIVAVKSRGGYEPLITIIVPVYKVEPYLRKCMDSIFVQRYSRIWTH